MPPPNGNRVSREGRHAALAAAVVAGFGLIALGLVRLQVADHQRYETLSRENHVRLEVLRAPRGVIYDRNGVLLADSAPGFRIVFRPFPAESAQQVLPLHRPEWLQRVCSLVELDSADVVERVRMANASGQTAVLRRNAPFAVRAAVEELRDELPGIEVQIEPLRHYPYGTLAAHVLGYAGEINDTELDSLSADGYRAGDLIGRSGVERSFEQILRGQNGSEFVVVNASGRRVSAFSEQPPQMPEAGHDIELTLDIRVQQALEQAMDGVERGAAVAIDPRDGGVLGMVSRPAFDPNEFSVGITSDRWQELIGDGSNPLLNRAIQGLYPPGSTFKTVTMVAALRTHVATPTDHLAPCDGTFQYGRRTFRCWKASGHGSLDFIGALQHSCDIYFYQIGLKLGLGRLEDCARAFGFGARTGIDLPQEKGGLVPGPAWYARHGGAVRLRQGVMLNLAIGQGELLVTPLQLALMSAEVAEDGRPLRPHVLREVRGVRGYKPPRPIHPGVSAPPEDWEAVHKALELVVSEGTGTAARVPGVEVAGKTGTAQNPHGQDHALFICYAPADDPQIAISVVIENGGHGGSAAAPRAGQVLRALFLPDSLRATTAAAAGPGGPGD